MDLFGEVVNGELVISDPEKLKNCEGERVVIKVFPLTDKPSEGQLNTMKMWIRVISEHGGISFGSLYNQICDSLFISSPMNNLKGEEVKKILNELEWIASDLEIIIPFPKKWNRSIFKRR